MNNTVLIDEICEIRQKFENIAITHADDEGIVDCINSSLGNNEFVEIDKIKKDYEKSAEADRLLKIGIVGAVKAGKSSLLNALFFNGKDILPKAARPMTAALTELYYGEDIEITIDFFTEDDILKLKDRNEQYIRELEKLKEQLEKEKKEAWLRNQKRIDPSFNGEPTIQQEQEWETSAERDAKRKLQNNIFLAGAAQQYEDIKNAPEHPKEKQIKISADSIDDIAGMLNDYVGSEGKFTAFTSKVSISLPLLQLQDVIIIDTPGFNDPVPSREERARNSLRECDVILILSPARQFLSANDKEVLAKITTKNGIRELFLIQSQIDSQLFNLEIKDAVNGDLDKAIDQIVSTLNGETKKNLSDINENKVFDELITETSQRSFPTSGLCQSMADTFSDKLSWDPGRIQVWNNLKNNYPDYFSDNDDKTSINSLKKLGNIASISSSIISVKTRKQEIFKDKLDKFEKKYKDYAEGAKKEILEYISIREKNVQEKNIKVLEAEIKELTTSYERLAPELKDVLLDTVNDWYENVKADYSSRLEASRQGAKTGISSAEGSETETWTTGWWFWKENHSTTYTTVNTSTIKNSIADFIDDYNNSIPHYINTQIRVLIKNVQQAVNKLWIETFPNTTDSSYEIRHKTRTVMMNLGLDYDLEYKNQDSISSLFSLPMNSSFLKGSLAEEFLAKANSFIRDLNSQLKNNLKDCIEDIEDKCNRCDFPKLVLDSYLQQLQKKKEEIEKPKLALENLRRIKSEIESIKW